MCNFNGVDWLTGETPRFNNGSSGDMDGNAHVFEGWVVVVTVLDELKSCCDTPGDDVLIVDGDNKLPIPFVVDDEVLEDVSPAIDMLIRFCGVYIEGSILPI